MNAATAATANDVALQLWNPSTTKGIYVKEIWWAKTAATVDNQALQRSTARGATPGATVTPDIDNEYTRAVAPVSTTVLETSNFATEPTLATPVMAQSNLPAAIGSGFIWVFGGDGIFVPSATGLCVVTPVAVIMQIADFTVVWDE